MSVCLALQTMQGRMSYSLFKLIPLLNYLFWFALLLWNKNISQFGVLFEKLVFFFISLHNQSLKLLKKKERDWSWTDVKLYFKKSESVVNAKTQLTSNHLLIIDEKEPSTRYRKFIDLGNRNVKTTRLFTHLFSSLY